MGLLELLSFPELVAQLVSFLLLMLLLRVFLWKRFLRILDDRKSRIADDLKIIDAAKEELGRIETEYKEKMGDIEAAARMKIQEAIVEGKRIAAEIIKDAEHGARKSVDESRETIKTELQKARETLKEDIVDIAIKVAEKVVEEKLTEKEDKRLIEDFLRKVEKTQ
ncbi:MAG: F0F1 ATP synthase subunit B [Candidatus Omnitrophota bacterium]